MKSLVIIGILLFCGLMLAGCGIDTKPAQEVAKSDIVCDPKYVDFSKATYWCNVRTTQCFVYNTFTTGGKNCHKK